MLVVKKGENKNIYGVIDTQGKTILEAKYDNITYLPNVGDFLVESNKKVGVLSKNGETKIQIIYDSIELMDSDAGLYVVKKDNKYGVLDLQGKTKIFINGRNRIPDKLTDGVLTEVKNVKYISNTQQLKDFADFAHQTGRQRRNYSKMNYDLMWSPFMKDVMLI